MMQKPWITIQRHWIMGQRQSIMTQRQSINDAKTVDNDARQVVAKMKVSFPARNIVTLPSREKNKRIKEYTTCTMVIDWFREWYRKFLKRTLPLRGVKAIDSVFTKRSTSKYTNIRVYGF